jgi:hypothetical protein
VKRESKKELKKESKREKKYRFSDSEESNHVIVSNSVTQSKSTSTDEDVWHIDSACTANLTYNKNLIINSKLSNVKVTGPHINAKSSTATIEGEVIMRINNQINNTKYNIKLDRVLSPARFYHTYMCVIGIN